MCKILDNILLIDECQELIDKYDNLIDEEMEIGRYDFKDIELSKKIWMKIKDQIEDIEIVEVSHKWYLSKYWPKTSYIGKHIDGNISYDNHALRLAPSLLISKYTIIIYLNENFENGETEIFGKSASYKVKPKVGSILIMQQDIFHRGVSPIGNYKYILRSDLMKLKK